MLTPGRSHAGNDRRPCGPAHGRPLQWLRVRNACRTTPPGTGVTCSHYAPPSRPDTNSPSSIKRRPPAYAPNTARSPASASRQSLDAASRSQRNGGGSSSLVRGAPTVRVGDVVAFRWRETHACGCRPRPRRRTSSRRPREFGVSFDSSQSSLPGLPSAWILVIQPVRRPGATTVADSPDRRRRPRCVRRVVRPNLGPGVAQSAWSGVGPASGRGRSRGHLHRGVVARRMPCRSGHRRLGVDRRDRPETRRGQPASHPVVGGPHLARPGRTRRTVGAQHRG